MRHVGALTFLRDKIHVSDVYTCIDASRLFAETQERPGKGLKRLSRFFLMLHYLKKIVSALTGKSAWVWQVRHIDSLMAGAGFSKSDAEPGDAKKSLNQVCAWIGARLGMTMERVAAEMAIDEIQPTIFEIMKYELEKGLSLVKAYHLPEKFSEEILAEMKKLNDEVKDTRAQISGQVEEVRAELDRFGRNKNTFAAGFLQPC